MKIPLSARLEACCRFVNPGDRVADIGCDHGYLGIHLLKNGIADRFQKILMQSLGLATIFIGIGGVLKHMLVVENGSISTQGTILLPPALWNASKTVTS